MYSVIIIENTTNQKPMTIKAEKKCQCTHCTEKNFNSLQTNLHVYIGGLHGLTINKLYNYEFYYF